MVSFFKCFPHQVKIGLLILHPLQSTEVRVVLEPALEVLGGLFSSKLVGAADAEANEAV